MYSYKKISKIIYDIYKFRKEIEGVSIYFILRQFFRWYI